MTWPSDGKSLRSNTNTGWRQQHEAEARLKHPLTDQQLMGIQPRAGHATSPASVSFSLKAFYQGFDPTISLHLSYPLGASRHEVSLMGELDPFGHLETRHETLQCLKQH